MIKNDFSCINLYKKVPFLISLHILRISLATQNGKNWYKYCPLETRDKGSSNRVVIVLVVHFARG